MRNLITIDKGSFGYEKSILTEIYFSINSGMRVAILGGNGSGKSSFIKALLSDKTIKKTGFWSVLSQ